MSIWFHLLSIILEFHFIFGKKNPSKIYISVVFSPSNLPEVEYRSICCVHNSCLAELFDNSKKMNQQCGEQTWHHNFKTSTMIFSIVSLPTTPPWNKKLQQQHTIWQPEGTQSNQKTTNYLQVHLSGQTIFNFYISKFFYPASNLSQASNQFLVLLSVDNHFESFFFVIWTNSFNQISNLCFWIKM